MTGQPERRTRRQRGRGCINWPGSPSNEALLDPRAVEATPITPSDRPAGGRRDLSGRLRHRGHRDELRDAGLALPQPLFRQRHLYLGGADLDRAGGADGRLFPRRLARRPHRLADGAGADRARRPRSISLVLPSFSDAVLDFVLADIDDVRAGSLVASFAILFFPVTLLGIYLAVRDPADAALAAALGHGVGNGLWRLHRGLDRRHARHHVLPDPADRHAGDHAIRSAPPASSAGWRCWRWRYAERRRPYAVVLLALIAAAALSGSVAVGARRKPGRRKRPCSDAQAPRRPHRPYRERVQRHFRQQAPRRADHVVPAQGLGLHRVRHQSARSRRPAAALRAGDDDGRALPGGAEESADDRTRRRFDLDLSRTLHAGRRRSTRSRSTAA